MTTYSCRTDALPIQPGQNLEPLRADQDMPQRQVVSGPGDASPFAPGSKARATSLASSRAWRRSGLRRARHPERLGPAPAPRRLGRAGRRPDVRLGRGEDDVKLPQGYGAKVGGDAYWGLNYMIHSLNADRRARGLHHLGDRLGARDDAGAHRHQPGRRSSGSTSRAPRRSTPSSTPSAASIATATASSSSPTRSRPTRSAPGFEERENISPGRELGRAGRRQDAGLRRRAPAPRRACSVDLEVARDGPDAGNVDGDDPSEVEAAVPLRREVLRARRRGQLGRQHGGDAAGMADQAQGGGHRLDRRDLRRRARRRGTSRWGSCRSPSPPRTTRPPRTRSTTPPRSRRCTTPAASSPTAACPRTSTARRGKNLKLPDPRKLASKGKVPAVRHRRSTASTSGSAATRRLARLLPRRRVRPPVVKPGHERHLHQPRRAAGNARRAAGLAQRHLV